MHAFQQNSFSGKSSSFKRQSGALIFSDNTLDSSARMVRVKGSSIIACMNRGMSVSGISRDSKIYGNYFHKLIFAQVLTIFPPFYEMPIINFTATCVAVQ
jgi:hypothetical protein